MKTKTELTKMRDKVQRLEKRCEELEHRLDAKNARIDYLESILIKLAPFITAENAKNLTAR